MILDCLNRISDYRGIHPNLDRAIETLSSMDLHQLPDGRLDLFEDDLFVNIMPVQLSLTNNWEAHREYIDLQIVLKNTEYMDYAPLEKISGFTPYDATRDIQQSKDPFPGTRLVVETGMFALFFPEDAHRPGIGNGQGRKAVFKIKVFPKSKKNLNNDDDLNHQGTQVIHTNRLLLRPFQLSDAEMMFQNWASDDEVSRRLTWNTHQNIDVTKTLLRDWVKSYDSGRRYQWAIEKDKELIGDIALMSLNARHKSGEIGYCLSRKYWNQGIMTEALGAVLQIGRAHV